ncbi:MAG: type IIL restriction-modification enzyme MmeI [Pseudomonadota bacterium]
MAALVAKFAANEDHYLSRRYSEAQLRQEFIDPFFEALGWDVTNASGFQLYKQDTVPEARLWKHGAVHYADYGFRIDGRTRFFVEAEAASRDVDNAEHIDQAIGYAWSSTHTDFAIVTDFEAFRAFDARTSPQGAHRNQNEIMTLRLSYKDYVERFPILWETLSKPAVATGAIDQLLAAIDPELIRESVDKAFLADLDRFRLSLGKALKSENPGLSIEELNAATHHILNQIVFGRVLEDRDIEPTGRLREAVEAWRTRSGGAALWTFLRAEFGRLERRYNGVIFAAHFSDSLSIPDDTLNEILDALYPPTSPYIFSIIPLDVLGRAYESYLGKRLEEVDGTLKLALRPEVRRAGGVFYTPDWMVDYILERTLTPKLSGKSPDEIAALNLLDPACGGGAFSVQMASRVLAAAQPRSRAALLCAQPRQDQGR